jgi:tRNA(Ile)-lysidine synthase
MSLAARVLRTIGKHRLFPRGARVIVALSGGPDSVALLHLMRELEGRGELTLAGAVHFNHQIRGAEADEDEAFCRLLAADLGLPIEVGRADVPALAREQKRSLEDAARTARYAFFEQAADRLHADVIAVGHSLDDQAETFLLRLIRGAGPRGLAGIRPRSGRVVRPMLEIARADLREYVSTRRLACREDASNADRSIARNRVRLELMPVLQAFSPRIADVLAREAAIAREDEDRLHEEAIDLAGSIVLVSERGTELDTAALGALPPALSSRVVREALQRTAPGRFFGSEHIERVLELVSGPSDRPRTLSLPGLTAARTGDRIVFGAPAGPAFSNSCRFPLSIPGEVALAGWSVSAEALAALPAGTGCTPLRARGAIVAVAAGALSLPLAVRTRRRGDRFRPLGLGGRGRKLQDFLVDRKVARSERDSLPLVVDSDDRIVWVAGQAVAEDFRVTEPSQAVILLKVRRLGGEG